MHRILWGALVILCLVATNVAAQTGESRDTLAGKKFSILPAGAQPVLVGVPGSSGLFEVENAEVYAFFQAPNYYICVDAIWYVGETTEGPWKKAEKIPAGIAEVPESSDSFGAVEFLPRVDVQVVAGVPYLPLSATYTCANGTVVVTGPLGWTALYLDSYYNPYVVCYGDDCVTAYPTTAVVSTGTITYTQTTSTTTSSTGATVTQTKSSTSTGGTVTQTTGPAGGTATTVVGPNGAAAVAEGPGGTTAGAATNGTSSAAGVVGKNGGKAGAYNGPVTSGAAVQGPGGASAGAVATPNHTVGWVSNGEGSGYVAVDGEVYQVQNGTFTDSSGQPVTPPTPETTGSVAQGDSEAARSQSKSGAESARASGETYASSPSQKVERTNKSAAAPTNGAGNAPMNRSSGTSGSTATPSRAPRAGSTGSTGSTGRAPEAGRAGTIDSGAAPTTPAPSRSADDGMSGSTRRGSGSTEKAAPTEGGRLGRRSGDSSSGGFAGRRGTTDNRGQERSAPTRGADAAPTRGNEAASPRSADPAPSLGNKSSRTGSRSGASSPAGSSGSHPFSGRKSSGASKKPSPTPGAGSKPQPSGRSRRN